MAAWRVRMRTAPGKAAAYGTMMLMFAFAKF